MIYSKSLGVVALLFLVAGCAVGPDYKRPAVETSPTFRGTSATAEQSLADQAWWDVYHDDRLKELIHLALTSGYDVRIAASRVEQARALAAEVHGQRFPAIGYTANADRGRNTQLGNATPSAPGTTGNGFDGYLTVAWELDLWGHVRRLDEAARANYLSSAEGQRGVMLSLASEIATAYFGLLELDEELAIARQATDSFKQSLDLFNLRFQGGVGSRLETASAEGAMASSAARIPELERQIAIREDQISILVGRAPGAVVRGASLSDQPLLPDVPVGLPSALLERRPDVLQAEYHARAANANVGVTIGSFLPRIGLSALFGGVNPQLNDLTSHKAELWNLGAQITGPVFQAGGLRGQYDAAKAAWEEARLEYEQTALNAFGEVADALVTRTKLIDVREQQARAVHAYQDALTVAMQRYQGGASAYFEVLQTQQQLFPAEVTLAQVKLNQQLAIVQLYKALGGGWKLDDAAFTAGH